MTDEELQQRLQEFSEGIEKLSKSEKPLSKEEKRYLGRLVKRQRLLEAIKEGREKKHKDAEFYNTVMYDLLVPWGEKHPVLMVVMVLLMRAKMASNIGPSMFRDYGKQGEK